MAKIPWVLSLALTFSNSCPAQEKATFSGRVNDFAGKGLHGANIVLYPENKAIPPSFVVSGGDGGFSVLVSKDVRYGLNITFMGFEPFREEIVFTRERTERVIVLQDALNELEEVVLNYTPPITVKKDTTTYQVEAFATGRERKLGALLKRLPGVWVNREGDVFFKERKVDAVLVENRTFFTGQPKMASKNIPADVIDQVQMIEDYSETPFLKEFENSDNLVMNLKLKEGKKNFVFGDIESGLGHRDRYRFHPSVFKYSPTLLHNFIGDLNNTASRSFTLSDYISMEGEKDAQGILASYNSPIATFLRQNDFYENNHYFGGYNFQYNPDRVHELRIFGLGMLDRSSHGKVDDYTYQASQALEQRTNELVNRNGILYGKLKYKYTPDLYTVLKLDAALDLMDLGNEGANRSILEGEQRDYNSFKDLESHRLNVNATAEKWFSGKNVSTADLHFSHMGESTENVWSSPSNIFSGSIPLFPSDHYRVKDRGTGKYTKFDLDLKHHFRPFRTHMISFGLNAKIQKGSLEHRAEQQIDGSSAMDLDGFSNDFNGLLSEINTSIGHKWYVNKSLIVDFGLLFRNIYWKDRYPLSEHAHYDRQLLPQAMVEWSFDEKKSLKFSYNVTSSNPQEDSRFLGQRIMDFNRIFEGNPYLEQAITERALLSLSLFKAYGFGFYSKLGYRKHKNPLVQRIGLQGIDGLVSTVQPGHAMNSYDVSFRGSYNRRYWKLSLENSCYIRESSSIFNGEQRFNDSFNMNNLFRFSTTFEEAPNVELEVINSLYRYSNPFFINKTVDTDLDFAASYDYGNWKFELSVFQNFYVNKSQSSSSYFNLMGARVFYNREDSPITIGFEAYNLGNNINRISTQYNSVYFAQYKRRVFPRTLMLTLNLKL